MSGWVGTSSGRRLRDSSIRALSSGRMLKAAADLRADLHPCKSTCVGGKKKAEKKDLKIEASGENGKEGAQLLLRTFYF